MKIVKQGTKCLVEVERFQVDGLDIWGINSEGEVHLGSYRKETDVEQVMKELAPLVSDPSSTYQMPQDFKFEITQS